jgi:nucleotide-binding universal stress UspA family protein
MTTLSELHEPVAKPAGDASPQPLRDVLCAVDDSSAALEAARQACALVEPDGRVTFLAVPEPSGVGFPETAFGPDAARVALDAALAVARDAGVPAEALCEEAMHPSEVVLRATAGRDLLAVGEPEFSRLSGAFLGSVASAAAHFHPASVLIARPTPYGAPFPQRIIAACDGSERSDALIALAVRLARRHGSKLTLLHAAAGDAGRNARFLAQAPVAHDGLPVSPTVRMEPGSPHAVIVQEARRDRASLVMVAPRGLAGLRALGSVSERVCYEAPCSVFALSGAD